MIPSAAATSGIEEDEQPVVQETTTAESGRPNLFHRWLRLQEFKGETAVTSHVVSPEALLVFRLIVALYYTAVVFGAIVYYKSTFFSFLTTAGSTSLCVYMWVASYHTFMYYRYKNANSIDHQHWALKAGLWLEYMSLPCFHTLIICVYWIFLYNGYKDQTVFFMWLDLSLHAIPLPLVAVEVFLGRYLFPIRFWFVPVVTLVQYMFLTWFVHAIWHYWVYSFLGVNLKGIMMFTGVHIAIAIFFVVWYAVHRLRDGFWAAMEARGIGYRARAAAADDATEGDKEEV